MKLRSRIVTSFSIAFLVVFGLALYGVYYLMAIYREQEFLQRLKDRTTTTYRLLLDVKGIDHNLMRVFDQNTINNLYDEKILLFDSAGRNIYSSVDDTKILFPLDVINRLKHGEEELFYYEGGYEVYAHSIIDRGQTFYAIGKAYDKYGRGKLQFLAIALFAIYAIVLFMVVIISYFLSRQITRPIIKLTSEVNNRNIENLSRLEVPDSRDEIAMLTRGFNSMLARVEESYTYQKNFIQHMSHELKTPIAVMMSNLERTMIEEDTERWRESFEFQKSGLMQMASVINTLLDISKYETNPQLLLTQNIRLDELIFECFESLSLVYPQTKFDLSIDDSFEDAEQLTCYGNERMLRIALFNLVKNASEYSDDNRVNLTIKNAEASVIVEIVNNGPILTNQEQTKLFKHFFRGQNSRSKAGIGLGLVMAYKIIQLHHGTLEYRVSSGFNCFTIALRKTSLS
jgi:two-component system sensor histidine kinase ArlS